MDIFDTFAWIIFFDGDVFQAVTMQNQAEDLHFIIKMLEDPGRKDFPEKVVTS